MLLSSAAQLRAATVTASWNPNPETNIAGYKLSYGTSSGSYTTTVDVGKVTSTVVTVNDATKYYFAVRAYNTAGIVSAYSTEVSVMSSGSSSTAPLILSLSPILGAAGTVVTIAGSNFGATQGTSTVTFNGAAAAPTSWSATSISVPVPSGATTGNVVVTVNGVASNAMAFTVPGTTATIAFVQQAYAVPASGTTVTVTLPSAQTAGNLNVVVVGWNDTTRTVQSVTDSKGNVYTRAVGPTVLSGSLSQSIYYAKNIAAAAAAGNTVTVTFSGAATYPDIRVAEYRGLDPVNPYDGGVGASGSALTSDSGSLTTTSASGLLVGANTVTAHVTAPGSGYTSRVITSPDGDILEDRVVTLAGSYNATAPVSGGSWVMQIAAFRAASVSTPVPTIASLSPVSGPVGASVTITGANFGSTKGTSTVTFNGTAATPTSWSTTSIVVPVPGGATTGSVVVTVGGLASNGQTFTVSSAAPSITSLSPTSGAVGTSVTITGANFGSTKGTSTVTFNGTAATPASWSATSIVVPVPSGATTGNVVVTVGGLASNGQTFTVSSAAPSITSLSPTSGAVGTSVTITGANFGSTKGTSTVTFNGTAATPASWSATSIVVPVPSGATTGNVVVTVGGVASNGATFTVTTTAQIAFVQLAYTVAPSASTVAVKIPGAQTAGNLNVVVVGWNDAVRTVQSIADSKGNVYTRAVGPTVLSGSETQSIYYAKNVVAAAAGANTVTVTFAGGAANYADIRVAEYSGLDPVNPLDGAVGATGSTLTPDSGSLTTTSANDLLVGANTVTRTTTGPGTGYTSRVITAGAGDIYEDRIVTSVGSYNATATVTAGSWVMQLAAFRAATVMVSGSSMTSMASLAAAPAPVADDSTRASDYDGDSKSDLAVFTPSTGKWAMLQSSSNYMNSFMLTLGTSSDVPVPGDYDGDGKADAAVYTPSTGKWTVAKSSSAYTSNLSTTWGVLGDVPVPGDYDGDRTTDFAVYRPSTGEWLLTLSATQTTKTVVLGASGDKPVPGDYDGDGRTDAAVFKPSTGAWTILTSSSNYTSQITGTIGTSTDQPVPGDYDGDGRMDMAVYRPSTGAWLILGSAGGYVTARTITLGSTSDIPVPSDYDGDGTTDASIFRQSTGQWTILQSGSGSTLTSTWGTSGSDVPLPRHP
jgi:IPT/TIG domain/FG-GAP-like repeat